MAKSQFLINRFINRNWKRGQEPVGSSLGAWAASVRGFCVGASASMQNACLLLPMAAIPHGGIHAQSIAGVTVCTAENTQLVTVAGSGFVPEHWAVIGLGLVGPCYRYLTSLQLRGVELRAAVMAFLCPCLSGITPAPRPLLVCSQLPA